MIAAFSAGDGEFPAGDGESAGDGLSPDGDGLPAGDGELPAVDSGAQILSAVAEPEEISVSLVLHLIQLEHKKTFSATENVLCGQVLH